ncbi:DUF6841 family protein [Paraglaciecola aestuariivivens]
MKLFTNYMLLCVMCFTVYFSSQARAEITSTEPLKQQEVTDIKSFFNKYMEKYNHYLHTKEFKNAPYLYADTIMVMSSSVSPYIIDSSEFYLRTQSFLDNLKSQGVERVGWINVNVRMIDKNLAIASNIAGRYKQTGDEFNRVGVTYLLRKNNNEWRITSFTVHNADGVKKL